MKYFFYFGHPSQFHFQKNLIRELKHRGHDVFIYIKSKDVLNDLLKQTGWEYLNILPEGRKNNIFAIGLALLRRNFILAREIMKRKPDVLVASDPSFSQLGFIFGIPSINCIDDDYDAVRLYSRVTYPFTKAIVTPASCRVGKWEYKRVSYNGYMKLAYLHPSWFSPDIKKTGKIASQRFFLIRLSKLGAYHDSGGRGISYSLLVGIIDTLVKKGKVCISSEYKLPQEFMDYELKIPAEDIHHFLYYADILVCDSQSMSGEAAMLGTPSVRISEFSGKIGVLDELEHKYGLTYSFLPDEADQAMAMINKLLHMPDLRNVFRERLKLMLAEKIDVSSFMIWFITEFPESFERMKKNPDLQLRFK